MPPPGLLPPLRDDPPRLAVESALLDVPQLNNPLLGPTPVRPVPSGKLRSRCKGGGYSQGAMRASAARTMAKMARAEAPAGGGSPSRRRCSRAQIAGASLS